MPTPDKPSLDYSYTAFQESQGDNSFPGTQLDNDLANLKLSIDETIDFVSLVVRDDGNLNNGVVTKNSLAADILTGIAAPRPWAAAKTYLVDETVTTNNGLYICLVQHVSGVFADDLAAGVWANLAVWSPLTEVADGTISTIKVQNGAITGPKLGAGSVDASKVQDGSLPREKMAANFGLMPIGATLPWDGPFAPAGWVFKFGQAMSRVTYAALMDALTAVVIGNAAAASNTLTGVSVDLRGRGLEGAPIEGPGIPSGATVSSVTLNTIVMSTNATSNASSGQYRVFPHGNGNGTTTFNIANDCDVVDIGRGNMGGTARGLVTASGDGNSGLNTSRLGALGGVDRHALTLAQTPDVLPTGTAPSAGVLTGQTTTLKAFGVTLGTGATAYGVGAGSDINVPVSVGDVARSLLMNALGGGGQAHPNVQPSRVTNKIIFTGVV